mgnify:FL=1|tara:strand:- start:2558 stop:3268 length:711 start_codon:yes stop_codon:yes gene_type:complete
MASSYSTSLKLEKMTTGEKAGLWGTVTNTNLDLVEQAVGGYVALSLGSGDQAPAISDGAESNGRNKVIKLTGTLTANRSLIFPDSTEKTYIVIDGTTRTTNHYTITIKTVSGSGLTMPVGATMLVVVDGTNVINGLVQKGYQTTTTAYTAVNGDQIFVDTSSTAVTITLPASPAVGNEVHFIDSKLSFNSNNLTIARNGQPINGATSNLTVNENGESFTLVYANSTKGWIFKTKKD